MPSVNKVSANCVDNGEFRAAEVLRRELSLVHRAHRRRGIASRLVWLGLNVDELRARGIDGIQTEAASYANQQLLKKHGFRLLRKAPE